MREYPVHLKLEPPPLYFMHVPKTGGMALGQWLRRVYGTGYFDLNLPQITKLTGHRIQDFRCYHAWHHGRSMLEWLGRSDLTVITMLRDPVERVISAFKFHQRRAIEVPVNFKPEFLAMMRTVQHSRIEACLEHELITHMLSNGQVRLLGIRKDYAAFLAAVRRNRQEDALLRPYDVPLLMDADDMPLLYANAHAWLNKMPIVGLTERYPESVLLVADLLGIPAPTEPPRANVNPQRTDPAMRYRDQLAPEVVARLEELNRYDLELYAHATELFEHQWARYRAKPQRTYSIAPRLRIPLRGAESRLKRWLRRTWPGLAQQVRLLRAKRRNRRTPNASQGQR
ncbi:sulfotransferase family 2 domain-containing protein [Candidatus Chloroploca sp. Khr17]|uniref:sulfotransferase family 2 domain-containing protein n=1 Tax=Candidatus Chloroploca sp. Khr17 TaxID=2496869 RepID=UPI0013EDE71F|nr:sulfotransferase family 2 domain-containing protein [Candidatus Chloroploca sp. Khr17]